MNNRNFFTQVSAAMLLLVLAMWSNSGTMNPYGLTGNIYPSNCNYLLNTDNYAFSQQLDFFLGAPIDVWRENTIMRRILYPFLAHKFMARYGFEEGGFIFNVLLIVFTFLGFVTWLFRTYGMRAATIGAWLFASYPGITYWGGLPYSYIAIVPASVGAFVALSWFCRRKESYLTTAIVSTVLGILSLAYDLLPYFIIAFVALALMQTKWKQIFVAIPLMALPGIVWGLRLKQMGLSQTISNNLFDVIIDSWKSPIWSAWLQHLANLPGNLASNFFGSQFFFLAILFLLLYAMVRRDDDKQPNVVEWAWLIAIFTIFLINNGGPDRPKFNEYRNTQMARLYQPMFIALMVYVARVGGSLNLSRKKIARVFKGSWILCVAANFSVIFGVYFGWNHSAIVYQRFYEHAMRHTVVAQFNERLEKYGRRPMFHCLEKLPPEREAMNPP